MRWIEKPAELQPRELSELIKELSFIDALFLMRRLAQCPQVSVERGCREGIDAHLRSRRTELGGLLIGRAFMPNADLPADWGCVVLVQDFVPSEECRTTGVSLAMGTEVWDRARERLGECMVVGWYHSHPSLGAFFSGTDRWTQRHFFNRPYSIGLVIDPIRGEEAWFVGPEATPLPGRPLEGIARRRSIRRL